MRSYTKTLQLYSSPSYMKNNLCTSPLHKKYRGHFEIIALLLEGGTDNGATKFSIMKHANINYKQLKKYLRSLTEIRFIEMDKKGDQCFYRTTAKGLDFLRQYHVLLGMLLSAFARNKPVSIAYETEYDATSVQQQSVTQFVTSPQHNP